ncbi:MAG TPA: IscS subfamily cysteine desulfurase [Chitinophagaceae bacterium]|nr:IscS subfamily cysteine desulfurase [Chitinophagaceae bacterium]
MLKLPVYLDHNATTPCDPAVLEAMLPFFTKHFGNAASRSHSLGWEAEAAVDIAREQVAGLINAETKEIIFTSGATESCNLAIKGVFEMYASKGNHIITALTEHNAVLDTCKHLEKKGAEITYLPVDRFGMINLKDLESVIKPTTILICLMYANNETGTVHPIKEISRIARKNNVLFFTDATQAAGKIPVNIEEDGIDLLAMSAHKMYGPKGVGCLYVRRKDPRVLLFPQIDGGGHERGLRSGTLNVPGIVGFGMASQIAKKVMKDEGQRLQILRDKLEASMLAIDETYLNSAKESRLPHTTNISFKSVESEGLFLAVNRQLAVSSGSACTSASMEPSHVLKAMGLDHDLAHSSIRFGLGRFTTEEEVNFAIGVIENAVKSIRTSTKYKVPST